MSNRKGLKIVLNAPVTLSFVFLCLLALLFNIFTNGKANELLFSTYHSQLSNPLTIVRLFTHVLGHSGWTHFLGNMTYILLLGPMLEEKYKSIIVFSVIIATALFTGIICYVFFPYVALCGASGVCFAFILLSSFTGFRKGEIPITFILVAVIFLGQQIVDGLFLNDNISNMAHIIGGVIGSVFGFVIAKRQ